MKKSFLLILVMSLSLIACGDGGGGDSATTPTTSVKIDNNNAETITAVAYDAARLVADQRSFTDFVPRSSQGSASAIAPGLLGYTKLGLSYIPATQERLSSGKNQARFATGNEPCDSGSITITVGYNDNTFDQQGEFLDLTFNNCVLAGDSLNGGLRMTIISWVSQFDFVINTSINLSTVIDGIAVSSNGSMNVGLMDNGAVATFTLSSSSITGTVGTETTTMTNLNVVVTESGTGYTSDLSMDISSNTIGGSVNIDTDPAFAYGPLDTYPDTGTLTVTGSDNSYVSLNADTGNLTTVILTIYDGSTTTSDEIPWSQLDTNY